MKKLSTFFAILLTSVLLIGSTSFGQQTWVGHTNADFSEPSNWSPTGSPGGILTIGPVAGGDFSPKMNQNEISASITGIIVNTGGVLDLNAKQLVSSGAITITGQITSGLTGARLTGSDITGSGTLTATNIDEIFLTGNWRFFGTFVTGSNRVSFIGGAAQTIYTPTAFNKLGVGTTAAIHVIAGPFNSMLGLDANITIYNQLDITTGGSTLFGRSATITFTGNAATPFANSGGGTFTGGSSKVIYQTSVSVTILDGAGVNYYNLDLNSSGKTFSHTGILNLLGAFTVTAGTYSGGTINCVGTTAQTIAGTTYNSLTINNTKGVTLAASASIAGNLTVTAGTFADNGYQINTPGTGVLLIQTAGTLKLGATAATTLPAFAAGATAAGTVEYASTANQMVSGLNSDTYVHLLFSGSGTKTAATNVFATNITINDGVTFDGGPFAINLNGGTWRNVGTGQYTGIGQGVVRFTGTANMTSASTMNFNKLENVGGNTTAWNNLNIAGDFTITAGNFLANGYNMTVGGNWINGATFTPGTGGVTLTGAVANISGATTFNNLTINGGVVTNTANLTINGAFLNSTGFNIGANTITFGGTSFTSTAALSAATSTINFTGTKDQTLKVSAIAGGNPIFNIISSAGKSLFIDSPSITVNGSFGVTAGTLNIAATSGIKGLGTFTASGSTTLATGNIYGFNGTSATTGAIQMAGNVNYGLATTSFIFNGTSAQTMGNAFVNQNVYAVVIQNDDKVLMNDNGLTNITDLLFLSSGSLTNTNNKLSIAATATIKVDQGSIFWAPLFGATVNVTYVNTTAINSGKEIPTNQTVLQTLTTGSGTLTLTSLVTVNNTLALGGFVSTGSGTLVLIKTATVTGAGTYAYVTGKMGYEVDGVQRQYNYPIGAVPTYKPVVLDLLASGAGTVYAQAFNSSYSTTHTLPVTLGGISTERYYRISSLDQAGAASLNWLGAGASSVTLSYNASDNTATGTHGNPDLRLAADYPFGPAIYDLGGVGSNPTVGIIFNSTFSTTLDGVYLIANAAGGANPLAVELTSFTGTSKENNIALSWTTATEHNNYGFNIERSVTGKSEWSDIGFVKGSGNSSVSHTYSFTDNVSGTGSFDYRIKQTDVNGKSQYIGSVVTVALNVPTEFALSQNYPNPFNPSTIIKYAIPQAAFVTLKIYNMLGQEVATLVNGQTDIGFHSITWNGRTNAGSFASSGVYIYRIVAGDFVQVKKMNLLK